MADAPDRQPLPSPSADGFESSLEGMPIRVHEFEGPLDLLVHLIRKHQVNVYDIPIALITQQYLEYLDLMQELDLDVASDFLVMAATLIHIKSRTLLPRPEPPADGVEDEDDPRDALVRRLIEHQTFKSAAGLLHERELLRSAQWTRPDTTIAALADATERVPELDVDLFSLLAAFKSVIERMRERPIVPLPAEQVPIETRIEQLMAQLATVDACGFDDLFADARSRADLIVTFLALLEMIRLKLVRVQQSAQGMIRIYRRPGPAGDTVAPSDAGQE